MAFSPGLCVFFSTHGSCEKTSRCWVFVSQYQVMKNQVTQLYSQTLEVTMMESPESSPKISGRAIQVAPHWHRKGGFFPSKVVKFLRILHPWWKTSGGKMYVEILNFRKGFGISRTFSFSCLFLNEVEKSLENPQKTLGKRQTIIGFWLGGGGDSPNHS